MIIYLTSVFTLVVYKELLVKVMLLSIALKYFDDEYIWRLYLGDIYFMLCYAQNLDVYYLQRLLIVRIY